ncbi:50S ribosomal protein L11 methyltransferase [Clostridium sp. 'deep sea']|uniref:50S ribosomal protein L11 methyltransferase n=1 Tax=Clostridium sp. 'deep sea' TaxID=2779445 RepID=UPI001896A2B6|nr:50S ribosomal protein L11 methyltransferase [Clostridium sp. 'deep sea']QOR35586.1 50S ribosomal protein L11 methyltransferase [Clostridium sp. 'deep sea']
MTQWMEIKILTKYSASDAVGEVLYRNGVNGLVYEDLTPVVDLQSTIDWDYSSLPVVDKPLEEVYIVAYLPLIKNILEAIEDIKAEIELLRDFNIDIGKGVLSYRIVDEADWQDNWKKYFVPINVGKNLIVRPIWEDIEVAPGKVVINIDPGLAFGTGSHATTQQVLIMLEKYLEDNSKVIDVGCGSGILSITAHKLGAKTVTALDYDNQAVSMTKSNMKINNLNDNEIEVYQNDLLNGISKKANIILANITAPILTKLIPQTVSILNKEGLFICAGIIDEYEYEVQKCLLEHGYIVIDRLIKNDWVSLTAKRV